MLKLLTLLRKDVRIPTRIGVRRDAKPEKLPRLAIALTVTAAMDEKM
jgi:hypothetical protein